MYIGKTYKGEVDFIATKGEEKIYIQAAYLLSDEKVVEKIYKMRKLKKVFGLTIYSNVL